jgi:hypothetical protein
MITVGLSSLVETRCCPLSLGQFHYRRVAFSSQIKSKVENILTKAAALRINLNIDKYFIYLLVFNNNDNPTQS